MAMTSAKKREVPELLGSTSYSSLPSPPTTPTIKIQKQEAFLHLAQRHNFSSTAGASAAPVGGQLIKSDSNKEEESLSSMRAQVDLKFLETLQVDVDKRLIDVLRTRIPHRLQRINEMLQSGHADDLEFANEYYEFVAICTTLLHWLQSRKPPYSSGTTLMASVQEEMYNSVAAAIQVSSKAFSDTYSWMVKTQPIHMQMAQHAAMSVATYASASPMPSGPAGPAPQPVQQFHVPAPKDFGGMIAAPQKEESSLRKWAAAAAPAIVAAGWLAKSVITAKGALVASSLVPLAMQVYNSLGSAFPPPEFAHEVIATVGRPSFWLACIIGATPSGAQLWVQWLEESQSGAGAPPLYTLGGSQLINVSCVLARRVPVTVVNKDPIAIQIAHTVLQQLQSLFDDVTAAAAAHAQHHGAPSSPLSPPRVQLTIPEGSPLTGTAQSFSHAANAMTPAGEAGQPHSPLMGGPPSQTAPRDLSPRSQHGAAAGAPSGRTEKQATQAGDPSDERTKAAGLVEVILRGEKRHVLTTVFRFYHGVLSDFHNNRETLFYHKTPNDTSIRGAREYMYT